MSPLASRSMRSLLTIATVSSKHSGKYRCSPSQVVFLASITLWQNSEIPTPGHPWLCNGAGEVSRGHRSFWTGDQLGEQTGWKRTSGSLLRNLCNDKHGGQAGWNGTAACLLRNLRSDKHRGQARWEGVRTSPIYGCKLLTLYSSHQESKRTLQKWRQTCATNREWIFRGKEQSELWWNQLAWMESHVDFEPSLIILDQETRVLKSNILTFCCSNVQKHDFLLIYSSF